MSSSLNKTKPRKRDAILNAMLDVVVERGFHEAPMSLIAERAGASAGVIYHYFASKDEMIQALYARIRTLTMASLLEGYSADIDAKEAFIKSWVNLYAFYYKHQREMRFLEQYEKAGFVCQHEEKLPEIEAFGQRFSSQSKGGVLKDWPPEVLKEMTVGLVARLAQQPHKLSTTMQQHIAEKMWKAVRAK